MSEEGAFIQLPELLLASPRKHQQLVRAAMAEELDYHHRNVIPEHFKASAHQKYNHKDRSPKYIAYKVRRYRTGIDHIASGRTMAELRYKRQIIVSGTGDTLQGQLKLRLPFGGGTGATVDADFYRRLSAALATETNPAKRAAIMRRLQAQDSNRGKVGVTPAQQIAEFETVTQDEARAATERIGNRYRNAIRAMKRPRYAKGVTPLT